MAETGEFYIRFWGVRGSIACPGTDHQRYGGNTSCVEVRCGESLAILDAGTGLRALGESLPKGGALKGDIFLTHTHIDHINGLPFFAPLYEKDNRFRLWAGHLTSQKSSLHQALCQFMAAPLFPVPPKIFTANVSFHDFKAGETLETKPGLRVLTQPLNHPNGATGYRLECAGRSLCYVTDTEHKPGVPDEHVLKLIDHADLVIYDATYCDEEFDRYVSWGHSTWQEGVRLAEAAGVGRLVIFHHDPSHDDAKMDEIAKAAETKRPGTLVAREGMELKV